MKKIILFFLGCMASLLLHAQATYDFSATNSNGYTLYYKILDPIRKRVEIVTAPGSMGMWGGYSCNGPCDVPATVENNGVTYNVVSINVFFMLSQGHGSITELTLHEGLEKIGYTTFWQCPFGNSELVIPSTVTSLGGSFYQPFWTASSVTVRILNPIPTQDGGPCFATDFYGGGSQTKPKNLKIIVPVDVTHAYCNSTQVGGAGGYSWSSYADYYREELKIGPNGYTSYYLENENFEVPAGCTAYIIKTVTQQGSANLGLTTEEAFAAGSVIPKQTGFILKGTAGSTVTYRANLTGVPEVDVTGNLLVGTATEQEFSGAGYKYYLFGKGVKGQGFYHQTGRDGNSIKLGAHRAGLKLATSGFAPAKELIFNFDDATTTGINNVQPVAEKKNDVIYDLQGRRVTNPSRGIYIVNGKKVVISK